MGIEMLVPREAGWAGGLLARAFREDALMVHMLPDPVVRERLAPAHFERAVRLAVATGEVWRTKAFDAVACWIAPGRWPATDAEVEAAGLHETPELLGAEAWDRFRVVYEALDRAHGEAVFASHWILHLIGVEPGRQGGGLGTMLLRPVLERADQSGEECYLETLEERNLPFYARLGFDVTADAVESASGLRYWCCVRQPASRADSLGEHS